MTNEQTPQTNEFLSRIEEISRSAKEVLDDARKERRAQFAAMALQGLLSFQKINNPSQDDAEIFLRDSIQGMELVTKYYAKLAVMHADALIEELDNDLR